MTPDDPITQAYKRWSMPDRFPIVDKELFQAGYLAALEACLSELQRLLNIDDNRRERIDDVQDLYTWLDQQIAQAKETT